MEDLAVVTALNHSGSFRKNFLKLKKKKKKKKIYIYIYILFTSLGRSVLGKTVRSVLSTTSGGTQDLEHSFS